MAYLPTDPYILLSYINTKLRDDFPSLDDFCEDSDADRQAIETALSAIGAFYDPKTNQFITRSES